MKNSYQFFVQDANGNAQPSATITVRRDGNLVPIFSDKDGTSKTNPFQATSDAYALFYADAGTYNIKAEFGTQSFEFVDVQIGTQTTNNVVQRYYLTSDTSSVSKSGSIFGASVYVGPNGEDYLPPDNGLESSNPDYEKYWEITNNELGVIEFTPAITASVGSPKILTVYWYSETNDAVLDLQGGLITYYEDVANEVISTIGGVDIGNYEDDETLNYYNEYVVYDRVGLSTGPTLWKAKSPRDGQSGTPLPYTIDSTTYPDPTSDPNIEPFGDANIVYVQERVNSGDSQLIGGSIWPLDSKASANIGDTGLVGVTALRNVSENVLYLTSEPVYGAITALDFNAGTATIGGVSVTIQRNEKYATDLESAKQQNYLVGDYIRIGRSLTASVGGGLPAEYFNGYGAHQLPNGNWLLVDVESENGGVIFSRFGAISSTAADTAPEEAVKVAANTEAIKAATRYCQYTGQRIVWAGTGVFKYNEMQLAYHSTNAPWLNSEQKAQRLKIIGVGQMDDGEAIVFAKTGVYQQFRTVFESVNSTPALTSKTDLSQFPVRGTEIEQLTLVSDNLGPTVDIDQLNTNARLSNVTIVQKNGDGDGLRWYDSWMYSMNNVFGINVADTVSSSSLGCELKNPTIAGGMIDLTQVTFQGFGVNYVFGERNFSNPTEIISGITTNGVQGLKGATNFEYCKGCISSSGNIRSEQASTKGVRFFNFCRDITITNLRSFNPTAAIADVEFGVSSETADKKNAHINVKILGGQADVNNNGIVRYSSTDSTGGGVENFRLFQSTGSGSGVGANMNNSSPNGFDLKLILDSSLTTPTSGALNYPTTLTTNERTVRREIRLTTQIASSATITLPESGNKIQLTGSTTVTDITPVVEDMELIIFSSAANITDTGNLKLNGDYTASLYSMIVLEGQGGFWVEKTRSLNT
jgi:hypothetical protein